MVIVLNSQVTITQISNTGHQLLTTMAQMMLDASDAPEKQNLYVTEVKPDEMKVGLVFADEETALNAVLKWGESVFFPLMKARKDKTLAESGGRTRGRRCLDCPHGRSRKGKAKEVRVTQSVKYTKCPAGIVITENDDGSWEITKAVLDHFGHLVNQREYYAHEHTKRLNNEEQDYLKELIETKANTNNVAACLNRKTGKHFNGQDVRNLIRKINDNDSDKPKSEDILTKIKKRRWFCLVYKG